MGTAYREHQQWTTKKQGDQSQKLQEDRWARWLKSGEEIWKGREEAYLMGDLNLDLASDKNKKNVSLYNIKEVARSSSNVTCIVM